MLVGFTDIRQSQEASQQSSRCEPHLAYLWSHYSILPQEPSKQPYTAASDSPYNSLGELESDDLLSFAYQIASGMVTTIVNVSLHEVHCVSAQEYLSSLNIVHRDLACRNILVGEDKSLKISDFGMSRVVAADDVYVKSSRGRLPWKWMAIESIALRDFTAASDVWSYGVVLWEIATLGEDYSYNTAPSLVILYTTGGYPYPSIPNVDLLEHLQSGGRLDKPSNCASEV